MTNFTQKHYIIVAEVLGAEESTSPAVVKAFCELFAVDSPHFDVHRFQVAVEKRRRLAELDKVAERINREWDRCEVCGDTADWCPERGWK